MIARQYIFTRWFNKSISRDGFQEYSQSEGISVEDADFIRVNTRYEINRASGNLPYMPTQEEIETLFPRNTAYFKLPSGKYCLAQTCCATDPVRPGNYFIHAYIFDGEVDFNPLDAIDGGTFRRYLAEEEKASEKAPAPLPQVNVDFRPNIDAIRMRDFFAHNAENLKYLLSAVIYAIRENKRVYIHDDMEKRLLWYKALRMCLPESACAKITYGTYMCPASDDVTASLRIITSYNRVFVEKLKSRLAAGEYVYNFKDDVVNNSIKISSYAERVVYLFTQEPNSAITFIKSLEQYTAEAGGDIELALLLSAFYSGTKGMNYTSDDLTRVIACADRSGRYTKVDVAEMLARIIYGNPSFPVRGNGDLYGYVLKNGGKKWKDALIESVINEMAGVRVPVGEYNGKYAVEFSDMPVGTSDFAAYVAATCGYDNFVNKHGLQSFAVYALALAVIDGGLNPQSSAFIDRYLYSLLSASMMDLFTLVLNKLGGLPSGENIINSVISKSMTAGGVFWSTNYNASFAVLEVVKNYNAAFNAFVYMIETHLTDPEFTKLAEKYMNANASIATKLEGIESRNAAVHAFMEQCAVSRFIALNPDEKALEEFYKTYYDRSDNMRTCFVQAFERFIAPMSYNDKAVFVLRWLKKLQSDRKIITPQFKNIVNNSIYNPSIGYAEYKALFASNKNLVKVYNDYLRQEGRSPDIYSLTVTFADALVSARKNETIYRDVMVKLLNDKVLLAVNGGLSVDALAEYHLDDILELYLIVIGKEKAIDIDNFVDSVIYPISENAKFSEDNFVNRLKKMPKKNVASAVICLLRRVTDPKKSSRKLKCCMDRYFNDIGKGKGKKLINEILTEKDSGEINQEVKKYLEQLYSGNKGLLAKIFDAFKPKN